MYNIFHKALINLKYSNWYAEEQNLYAYTLDGFICFGFWFPNAS